MSKQTGSYGGTILGSTPASAPAETRGTASPTSQRNLYPMSQIASMSLDKDPEKAPGLDNLTNQLGP